MYSRIRRMVSSRQPSTQDKMLRRRKLGLRKKIAPLMINFAAKKVKNKVKPLFSQNIGLPLHKVSGTGNQKANFHCFCLHYFCKRLENSKRKIMSNQMMNIQATSWFQSVRRFGQMSRAHHFSSFSSSKEHFRRHSFHASIELIHSQAIGATKL